MICPRLPGDSVAEGGLVNPSCLTSESGFSGPALPGAFFFVVSPTLKLTLLELLSSWARSGQLWPPQCLGRKHKGKGVK